MINLKFILMPNRFCSLFILVFCFFSNSSKAFTKTVNDYGSSSCNILFLNSSVNAFDSVHKESQNRGMSILEKSFEKCQSIQKGYFEMTHFAKFMASEDTNIINYSCYFKKMKYDTVYPSAFHYEKHYNGKYINNILYTGEDFINYRKKDSSGVILSKELWSKQIKNNMSNYICYSPFTNQDISPINPSIFNSYKTSFDIIGEENIDDILCYHIKVKIQTDKTETLTFEWDYWISKRDYTPLQYSNYGVFVQLKDTMYQYNKYVLTKYSINSPIDSIHLSSLSIPSFINLSNHLSNEKTLILSTGSPAPNWTLFSIQGDTVSLSNYKGKLVLLDFFYKSCIPCMKALPGLQKLHEKYESEGLVVIGINPIDKNNLSGFLYKRGINYTILFGDKDIAKSYGVAGYPTIYLIDKKGNILFTQVGYVEGNEKKLEDIIRRN